MNRRTLLQLLSAGWAAPVAAGLAPLVAPAYAAQAPERRMGLNLTATNYWAVEQPFSNLAFNASRWRVQIIDAPFTWDTPLPPMTEDGYPKEIPPHSVIESFLIFSSHRDNLPVNLSVHYDGKGKLGYYYGAELDMRHPGRDDVRNLRGEASFAAALIETDPNDPLRNIRIYERGEEPKQAFRQPFIDRLGGMSTVRFMDWMATNNSEMHAWADRQKPGHFGRSEFGVPLETMIELCNTAKVAPWFTLPHLADDDYVRRFADLVLQTLDPSLPVHVEYSNEVWNDQFDQAAYCEREGLKRGLSTFKYEAQLRYYAMRAGEVLAIWDDVFSADKERVIGIYGAQYANDWTSETILSFDGVRDHADVLAIAPYFGGGIGWRSGPRRWPAGHSIACSRNWRPRSKETTRR